MGLASLMGGRTHGSSPFSHLKNISHGFNIFWMQLSDIVMFCKENEDVLKQSIIKMSISDAKLIQDKIKKTYKNRYFMLTNK
jgi:hypothetical protein